MKARKREPEMHMFEKGCSPGDGCICFVCDGFLLTHLCNVAKKLAELVNLDAYRF